MVQVKATNGQPSQRSQFAKRLPHADQSCAAARRVENDVGKSPAHLLGQFQPHRLLALDPIGLLQGREIEPAAFLDALANDGAAIVDIAVDAIDPRALRRDLAHIHFGRIGRAFKRLDGGE